MKKHNTTINFKVHLEQYDMFARNNNYDVCG